MKGFVEFIRDKGVVGLAVGFILGGAVQKVVTSLIADIISPVLSVILGAAGDLKDAYLAIGPIKIMWGDFTANLIDFLVIAFVVYFGVTLLKLDRLDKSDKKA
jgi:large conductance mechanosensitive channel